jgi:hypothetical protein
VSQTQRERRLSLGPFINCNRACWEYDKDERDFADQFDRLARSCWTSIDKKVIEGFVVRSEGNTACVSGSVFPSMLYCS